MPDLDAYKELIRRYVAFHERANDEIMKFIAGVHVPNELQPRVVVAYMGTILEYSHAFIDIFKRDHISSSQIVLRSILEAYVDLRGTLTVPGYADSRDLYHHEEWLKVLKAAKAGGNPYLADVTNDPAIDEKIQERLNEIAILKTKGVVVWGVKVRFEKADALELYPSIYSRLCAAAHNDSGELARRHVVRENDGTISLVMSRQIKPTEYAMLIDTACGLLISAVSDLRELPTITGDFEVIEKLRAELRAVKDFGDQIYQ